MSSRYSDGSVANLLYTSLGDSALSKEYIEIYFDGKVLVIDDFRSLMVHGSTEKGWGPSDINKGHMKELEEFAKYIQSNSDAPPIPLVDMVDVTMTTFQVTN